MKKIYREEVILWVKRLVAKGLRSFTIIDLNNDNEMKQYENNRYIVQAKKHGLIKKGGVKNETLLVKGGKKKGQTATRYSVIWELRLCQLNFM